jgi:hypothetical protein
MYLSDSILDYESFQCERKSFFTRHGNQFNHHTRPEPCSALPTNIPANVYDCDCGTGQAISSQLQVMTTQIVDVCG